ncbi:MAG: tyrosine-type recombinase/integrase [Betaproteobacteria bacterium]
MAKKKTRARWGDGQIIQVGDDRFLVRASGGFDADGRRIRPSRVVCGSLTQAKRVLRELQGALDGDDYVPSQDLAFGQWLEEWLEAEVRQKAPGTYELYRRTTDKHIIPALGKIKLQRLRTTHLRQYFNDKGRLAMSTLQQHYIIMHSALDAAVREGIVRENVAKKMMGKPRVDKSESPEDVLMNCWEAEETQRFLKAAQEAGPQWAALFALALDAGARRGELCGLQWSDIDWNEGAITIQRSLRVASREPEFGPVKNKRPRRILITPETLALLKAHRKHQAAVRLAMGPSYHDYNLVFAKEPGRFRHDTVGCPLQANNLGQREYQRIVKAAGVRRIKFHGLRHTCATLLLKARVPVHYVSARLGHKDVGTTLRIYAHAIPSGERELLEDLRRALGLSQG